MSRTRPRPRARSEHGHNGPYGTKEKHDGQDLLLKHYRGAPASVNDVPMEQWTPVGDERCDVNERRHLRMVARFGDDCAAVRMSNEHRFVGLLFPCSPTGTGSGSRLNWSGAGSMSLATPTSMACS